MIRIQPDAWREMVAHAVATYPHECCGAMLGSISDAQKSVRVALPLENASEGAQESRYELRPADLLRADHISYVIVPQIVSDPASIEMMVRWRAPLELVQTQSAVSDAAYLEKVFEQDGAQVYQLQD